jgi:hypothetical protein
MGQVEELDHSVAVEVVQLVGLVVERHLDVEVDQV